MYDWFILRLKCHKQCARILFRGWKSTSNEQLRYLEVLKHQERLNDLMKGTRHGCKGWKTLDKVNPIYIEGILK